MATIIVNTTLDESDGSIIDGDVSLRDALAFADSQPGADTITFASGAGEAFESGGTIRLDAALGEVVIASDVTIDGNTDGDPASRDITIDAQENSRVLNVTGGASAIDGLVITGGKVKYPGQGGGIRVADEAVLKVRDSDVSGNYAEQWLLCHTEHPSARGGGLHNDGTLILVNTTVSDNQGNGIANTGNLTLTNTTVSLNTAKAIGGGGIYNQGAATLIDSTVSGNNASAHVGDHCGFSAPGGGIHNGTDATLTLVNTAVSNNPKNGGWRGIAGAGLPLFQPVGAARAGGSHGG